MSAEYLTLKLTVPVAFLDAIICDDIEIVRLNTGWGRETFVVILCSSCSNSVCLHPQSSVIFAFWCTLMTFLGLNYFQSSHREFTSTKATIIALYKKLSYHRGTARRAMLVNLCYVSRAMGVIKVSNGKSRLQGHSRALEMVPFDRPHTISY